MRPGLSYVL